MQLLDGQLFKLQKYDKQGGTSQGLAQQLHLIFFFFTREFYDERRIAFQN